MTTTSLARLDEDGWELASTAFSDANLDAIRESVFDGKSAGARCLLDHPLVADAARFLLRKLAAASVISADSTAIQAIAFDKTVTTNWKVAWHQDLMFPFAQRAEIPGYDLPTRKDGIDYARPPREILENLLAARLHLDDCSEANGPLRVSPGTHRYGVLRGAEIARHVSDHGQIACLAMRGQALLMKPLTLHASSPATEPAHRRVLHFVFYSGPAAAVPWHRMIGLI